MATPISVVIPTHYRNELLPRAIESVLAQSHEPIELIVVDDSGERHAEPVIDRYPSVDPIYHDENGGWAGAYTSGITAATGDYVQLLDDDDYLFERKLERTAAVLDANPDVGVSYCGVVRSDDGEFFPKPSVRGDFLEPAMLFQTFPLWTGSMLIRRDVLLDCLPLAGMDPDDNLDIELGDTDLKIELAKRTTIDYVNECLVFYRREDNKLWTGGRRFKKVMQNVRHQQELYDRHPRIKRELLSNWYQRHATYLLSISPWSPTAIWCLCKSAYFANTPSARLRSGMGAIAALFGRPGWIAAERVRGLLD